MAAGITISNILAVEERRSAAQYRQERDRAEENFAPAQNAVNDFLTSVGQDKRLKQNEFYELRTRLLGSGSKAAYMPRRRRFGNSNAATT